ncbi:MAG: flavin reductase family protein [Candidatus Omnitrophota bacterium]|nr:flavin reductase family protein [Candidatus Omnitrophota bacterium]MBU1895238.1 flavin reductase family protein [Candidatus Omnitrophota bacterium]
MLKEISLDLATRLINHGPVVLVSSCYNDKVDITPVAWHMPISKKPPVIALEIGENHYIYECIIKSRDFAINIPPKSVVKKIVKCGSCSGRDVDKVKMCGFEIQPSKEIRSPAINGMMGVLECVLKEDKYLLQEYNIVLGEVKRALADEQNFDEHWLFTTDEKRTIHHLGNRTFCFPDGKILDLKS